MANRIANRLPLKVHEKIVSAPVCDSETYVNQLKQEFPRLRLISKTEHPFSRLCHGLLCVLSLGCMRTYLSSVTTTLGRCIYVPTSWSALHDVQKYMILRHEAVHLRQFARYGFVLMAFLYVLPFFPVGLAWGRAYLEREAYLESLRVAVEVYGKERVKSSKIIDSFVAQFCSATYLWMWPFPRHVRSWFERELESL